MFGSLGCLKFLAGANNVFSKFLSCIAVAIATGYHFYYFLLTSDVVNTYMTMLY